MCFASAWISERYAVQSPQLPEMGFEESALELGQLAVDLERDITRESVHTPPRRLLASTFSYDGVPPGKLESPAGCERDAPSAARLASGLPETPESAATGSSGLTTSAK